MPLLQHIVLELDRELHRLHEIRVIVAGLRRTPAVVRRFTEPAPAIAAEPASQPRVVQPYRRKSPRTAGQPRATRTRKPLPKTRALAVSVPSGPVVFYPKRPAAPTMEAAIAAPEPVANLECTPEQLEAESRALAARWASR